MCGCTRVVGVDREILLGAVLSSSGLVSGKGLLNKDSAMDKVFRICVMLCALSGAGCQSTSLYDPQADERLTVGTVQREISLGMTSTEVAEIMGSPNIVSTDAERHETWIYDKISTQVASKEGSAGVWLVIAGAGQESKSRAKSQRTLTVIIKFDGESRVKDFSYHTSRF